MANEKDKKKKDQKKQTGKRAEKAASPKPKTTKPAAKKSAPKSTAGKKPVKATKPVQKKSAPKKTQSKAPKNGALKPDWGFENEKPKSERKKKEEIIINIPKKTVVQPKKSKNVTKQVTEQLPDNAKLKTIHLHFRIVE